MDNRYQEKLGYFDHGVTIKKGVYFTSPSAFAKKNLIYILWGAEYHCDSTYRIKRASTRDFWDNYIIFHMLSGTLHFEYRGTTFTAHPGNIVLLDSRIPNHYWATGQTSFQFLHFNGSPADAYSDMLFDQQGACFPGRIESSFLFNCIFQEISQTNMNDHKLSIWMFNLIAGLALPQNSSISPAIQQAQQYIDSNFQKSLNVEEIANHASLSQYHFSRLFKQETSFSPHQYLMNARLKHARELLTQSNTSIDAIASICGFSSTSHFIYKFKKEFSVTPAIFRKFFDHTGFKS